MAVSVHVAAMGLFRINQSTGRIYQVGKDSVTIKEALSFVEEHRLVDDPTIPTTSGNPTIRGFLELEAAAGFEPVQVDQSMIITKKVV